MLFDLGFAESCKSYYNIFCQYHSASKIGCPKFKNESKLKQQPLADVLQNRCSLKISQISQENTSGPATLLKRNSKTGVVR